MRETFDDKIKKLAEKVYNELVLFENYPFFLGDRVTCRLVEILVFEYNCEFIPPNIVVKNISN